MNIHSKGAVEYAANTPVYKHGTSILAGGEDGYALVIALFIMVVLSGVTVTIANMSRVQNDVVEQAMMRARLKLSLQSGYEWAMYKIENDAGCDASTNAQVLRFREGGKYDASGSSNIKVTVTCTAGTPYDEGGVPVTTIPLRISASYSLSGQERMRRRMISLVIPPP